MMQIAHDAGRTSLVVEGMPAIAVSVETVALRSKRVSARHCRSRSQSLEKLLLLHADQVSQDCMVEAARALSLDSGVSTLSQQLHVHPLRN